MLGGAIPNHTGDLSRAVGAVKSLTASSSSLSISSHVSAHVFFGVLFIGDVFLFVLRGVLP